MRVGVLALQGDVSEHRAALADLGVASTPVRSVTELDGVDAIVLPGGESTAIAHLLVTSGLLGPLESRLRAGMPAFGTCAGLVLLASSIADGRPDQPALGLLDVTVLRNGYGRQISSFESSSELAGGVRVPTVFIRAPRITEVGDGVEVLATIDVGDGPHPVLVRQGSVLGASFHPELTADRTVHALFVDLASSSSSASVQN
ncbi:MAG TPA: pyridoxal 5'-phosphate synthase glutaminase subunit PdxT [Acidimicrobiales bacterium]|nr:pyridoxal 5'-phosphate synthase glutaminase subunit PdxT [Acidimicrobiales bacterium]